MITLTSDDQIGPALRKLRHESGLTMRQLGAEAHMSASGIAKREQSRAGRLGALIGHARALGCAVALVPGERTGRRNTGTGWPV